MKNISLFTTNMVYIFFHAQYKVMWMAGWLITKLFEGLHTEICKFNGKYFSFHLTSRQCFPLNFVNIQQLWLVDGLNCFYRTHACYEQQETHLWNIFFIYIHCCYPYPQNFKVTLNHMNSIYWLKWFCKMFNLFPVSYELFVRQRVYVYEFQPPCLRKKSMLFSKFIHFTSIIVLFKVSYMQHYL